MTRLLALLVLLSSCAACAAPQASPPPVSGPPTTEALVAIIPAAWGDPVHLVTTTTTAPPPTTTTTHYHPPTTTTTTAPPAPAAPSGSVWDDLRLCEAPDWAGGWQANTGNGYYGGLQFSLESWEAVGGTGYPHHHPREVQIEMGRRLQAIQGWGAWPKCSRELGLR